MIYSGHSGCEVIKIDNVMIKHNLCVYPKNRLEEQKCKQEWFRQNAPGIFSAPTIYSSKILNDTGHSDAHFHYIMEYVEFDDISKYNSDKLFWFVDNILKLIAWEFQNSINKEVDIDVLEKKKAEIESKTGFKIPVEFFPFSLPVGWCHGDLTLDNILSVYDEKIYLIDFLDSYINSPWIDIIKLRQDTYHKWILRKSDSKTMENILQYIDKYLEKLIPEKEYKVLQIMNLARILPYCKTKFEQDYLIGEIKCLSLT